MHTHTPACCKQQYESVAKVCEKEMTEEKLKERIEYLESEKDRLRDELYETSGEAGFYKGRTEALERQKTDLETKLSNEKSKKINERIILIFIIFILLNCILIIFSGISLGIVIIIGVQMSLFSLIWNKYWTKF